MKWKLMFVLLLCLEQAVAYEYSMTIVEDYKYDSIPLGPADLTPWGSLEANVVKKWLVELDGQKNSSTGMSLFLYGTLALSMAGTKG